MCSGSHVLVHLVRTYPAVRVVCLDKMDYCSSVTNLHAVMRAAAPPAAAPAPAPAVAGAMSSGAAAAASSSTGGAAAPTASSASASSAAAMGEVSALYPNFTFVRGDILDAALVRDLLHVHAIDTVLH